MAVGLLILLAGICGHARAVQVAPAPTLQADSGQNGLTTLRFNGVDLLADGALSAQTITLQNTDGTTVPTASAYDPAAHRLVQTYPWGTITCRYTLIGSRLDLAVAVTNKSSQTLQQLTL